jgi:hypothetical protein
VGKFSEKRPSLGMVLMVGKILWNFHVLYLSDVNPLYFVGAGFAQAASLCLLIGKSRHLERCLSIANTSNGKVSEFVYFLGLFQRQTILK